MSLDEFSSEFERQRYLFYHVHNTDPFGHYKPSFGRPTRCEADRRDKTVIMLAKYAVDKYNIAEVLYSSSSSSSSIFRVLFEPIV